MFPDRRERPRDRRDQGQTAGYSSPRLSQPLGDSRTCLSQAASLLSPPGTVAGASPDVRASRDDFHWSSRNDFPWASRDAGRDNFPRADFHVGASVHSSSTSCYRERLSLFQPNQRSRSVSSRKPKTTRKRKMWEHPFVCLASKAQSSPPGPIDRGHLIQAGLGEKLLSFVDIDDAEMLHENLLQAFPRLREGGGYELLRTCDRSSRILDVIPPPPSGYDITYLISVAGQANLYVRPLQKDLDLRPVQGDDTVSVWSI